MKKKLLWILLALIITGLGLYVITRIDLSILKSLSAYTVAYLIVLTFIFVFIHALGVSVIIKGMGYNVSVKNVYLVMTGGGAVNFIGDPKLGIPTRVFLFRALLEIPVSIATASVVLETALWLFIMAVIVAIPVPGVWGSGAWISSLLALAFVMLALAGIRVLPKIGSITTRKIFKNQLERVQKFMADFRQGMRTIKKTDLIKAVGVFTSGWLVNALSLYIILKEFGWTLNLFELMYISVFSYLVGTFSLLPMGLGPRDVSLVLLLTQLGPSKDVATAAALIQRTVRTVVPIILSLISINILGINRIKKLKKGAEIGESDAQACSQQTLKVPNNSDKTE